MTTSVVATSVRVSPIRATLPAARPNRTCWLSVAAAETERPDGGPPPKNVTPGTVGRPTDPSPATAGPRAPSPATAGSRASSPAATPNVVQGARPGRVPDADRVAVETLPAVLPTESADRDDRVAVGAALGPPPFAYAFENVADGPISHHVTAGSRPNPYMLSRRRGRDAAVGQLTSAGSTPRTAPKRRRRPTVPHRSGDDGRPYRIEAETTADRTAPEPRYRSTEPHRFRADDLANRREFR